MTMRPAAASQPSAQPFPRALTRATAILRRALGGLVALALALGLVTVAAGTGSAQALPSAKRGSAAASGAVPGNTSPNPVLARNASGYQAIEGVRPVGRTKIRRHAGARFAARTKVTAPVARVRLPEAAVAPGQLSTVTADVRAAGRTPGHLSVVWYDAAGTFLGRSDGAARTLKARGWTRLVAVVPAPATATRAVTIVNLLRARPRTPVLLTRHAVTTGTRTAAVTTAARPGLGENGRMRPALIAYGSARHALPFAAPGSLVIAGRDNYGAQEMKQVSAAGGTVLVYLDALIDNDHGRYHDLLLNSSRCGGAAARWPGSPRANDWGYLADFRPGSAIQAKLECVLETIVAENPHIGGFFADDLGSRSWFPGFSWDGFGAANREAYRAGAIELSKTFRRVADRHDLFFMVNGTWGGGSVAQAGGGYPDASRHGNALADGAMAELHTADEYWGRSYPCSSQWASQSPVTRGRPFHIAVAQTDGIRQGFAATGCYAFGTTQTTYEQASVWGPFIASGLPTRVLGAR